MEDKKLKLFGTPWCLKSANLRNYLQSEWIEFQDFDVENDDDAAEEVKKLYDGKLKFPTLKYGGDFLKNPSVAEVSEFLKKHDISDD